jgi:outer membrane lipoprotein-sorting protein
MSIGNRQSAIGNGLLALGLVLTSAMPALSRPRLRKAKSGLPEVLARMNDTAKHLKTVTANLDYTTVTVLVNDRSTESGRFYLRNPKNPEILIDFEKPDPKVILFKRNRAQLYYPKANRTEEYDLERHSELVQQFLLLGFGTEVANLKAAYQVELVGEEELEGESAAVLELTPKQPEVSGQLTKIQIWVSEDSWLPIQQKFFEPGGDYLIARYTAMKVNRNIPSSTFRIQTAPGVERVKKN